MFNFKPLLIAAAIFAALAPSLSLAAPTKPKPCERLGKIVLASGYNYANVYESKSTQSPVVTSLGDGASFCILSSEPGWMQISVNNNKGWLVRR